MSNVGTLTGLAAPEVAKAGEGSIVCLAPLANGDPMVQTRLRAADCRAGFPPHTALILSEDLKIDKGPPSALTEEDCGRAGNGDG